MARQVQEPEMPIEWSRDHDWLATLIDDVIGAYPGPRSPIGAAIRSWIDRYGWQRPGRIVALWRAQGTRLSGDDFTQRLDRLLERGVPVDPLPIPQVYGFADAQAIGICVLRRQPHGPVEDRKGPQKTEPRIRTDALHPGECGWCAYPTPVLIGWLREFNAWTDGTPEGRATMNDWYRSGRTERAAAIGVSQSVSPQSS